MIQSRAPGLYHCGGGTRVISSSASPLPPRRGPTTDSDAGGHRDWHPSSSRDCDRASRRRLNETLRCGTGRGLGAGLPPRPVSSGHLPSPSRADPTRVGSDRVGPGRVGPGRVDRGAVVGGWVDAANSGAAGIRVPPARGSLLVRRTVSKQHAAPCPSSTLHRVQAVSKPARAHCACRLRVHLRAVRVRPQGHFLYGRSNRARSSMGAPTARVPLWALRPRVFLYGRSDRACSSMGAPTARVPLWALRPRVFNRACALRGH
jgi:hypothetical protein